MQEIAIHRRALRNAVVVVGRPGLFADTGVGCMSLTVPLADGARHVGTNIPTIGPDLCRPAARSWVEPRARAQSFAPAGPNIHRQQAMAAAVERAVRCGVHDG
ncbi:hypothetical protein [Streptomyces olivaceus]|uniref:hypothetical protein n=1 Tax=Streptomyces olivaceus TaxID=47716 RepID=UPI0040579BAD